MPAPSAEGVAGAPGQRGLHTKLARSSIAAFAVYGTGICLSYGAQFVIARTIGAAGYGVYAYVFAWVTALAYFSALGFDISLMRFVPAYLAKGAFALLHGVVEYSWRRVTAVGCVIALTGIAFVLLRSAGLPGELTDTFLVGFPVVPVLAALWIRAATARGFGGVISALAPDRMVRDGVLLILVMAMAAAGTVNASRAMLATLIGTATGLVLVSLAVRRLRPRAIDTVPPVHEARLWRRTAVPLVIIGVAEALMNRTGVLFLGWMADTKAAGIYALVFNVAFAAMLPRTAVNTLLAPTISDLFVRNDEAALRAVVARSSLWTLLGAACVALPAFVLAEPLLALFGHDFVAGAPALRILLVGQISAAATGSQLHLMNMTGHERNAAVLLVLSAGANALLAAALVGPLGTTGAALATASALVGWNAAMGFSIRRHLRLWPGVLAAWQGRLRPIAQSGEGTAT